MKPIILALSGIATVVALLSPIVGEAAEAKRLCGNLVPDPGFEAGVSGFYAQGLSPTDPGPSEVMHTAVDPLEGSYSLRIDSRSPGQNFWWIRDFSGTGWYFGVSARLRSDVESSSDLQFCAMAYYADGGVAQNCTLVTGDAGDKGVVGAALNLDTTRALASVRIRMYQSGREDLRFTVDRANACLNPWEIPLDMPDVLPPFVYR